VPKTIQAAIFYALDRQTTGHKYPATTFDNHDIIARPRHGTFTTEIIHSDKHIT